MTFLQSRECFVVVWGCTGPLQRHHSLWNKSTFEMCISYSILLKSSETAQGNETCPVSDPLVPIIYPKSKSHLILMDTDSWDLAFLVQLKADFACTQTGSFCPSWGICLCSAALPRWAAGCFFWSLSIHYVTDSSNSLSATNEWWQWRLHYPIIHLPCLLMRRFPVTLGRPVLITLLQALSHSQLPSHRNVSSPRSCECPLSSIAKYLHGTTCL